MSGIKTGLRELEASGLLEEEWYARTYRDVAILSISAAEHYLRIGARLKRDPGPGFDTSFYLDSNPDVASSGINPLLHYLRHGRKEGRRCVRPQQVAEASRYRIKPNDASQALRVRSVLGERTRLPDTKTILVCAHVAGKQFFGGERSLLDVLDGLSDLGYNAVVTIPGGGGKYLNALRQRSIEVLSFRYGWWTANQPVDEKVVAEFAYIIDGHAIDAVHANTIMLREPLVAARRMGIPAILHARELISHDQALCERIGESPEAIVSQVLERADWIVANSQATANCFPKQQATFVVPNTVGDELFAVPPPQPSDTVRVALVSSNLPKKGILDFMEVAKLLYESQPSVRMVLIGPENPHVEHLRQEQLAGSLPPNISFSGYRAHPAEAMAEADIVINLSHFQESFGRTVLEAMAAARPVVAYDWGALPELVVEGETGFVVPFRDVAAVADRIARLCHDPGLIGRLGGAARERARAVFTKPRFAESLGAVYEHLFAEKDGALPVVLPARALRRRDAGQPLRLAYFLWHFPVPSETFVLNELRILVEQGYDVQVFCRQSPYKDFTPDFPITWTRVLDVADLADKLKSTSRNMVHSHFVYPTVTEMVWPACEAAGIPFTFIAHAQDIFRYANDEKNRIGEIGRSPWCRRVVVPSRFHRDYVLDRGVPSSKILINPNGVDPDLYRMFRDHRFARSRRSICAIHRFTAKKGLEHLIGAAQYLAEHGIDIHLYGYGELEDAYRRLIETLALTNVHLHGAVGSRQEMLGVFSRHDMFACPSVRAPDGDMDGIPTVLMEAMASGIPVVTTAVSGIPELVQDGITGFVCEATAEQIADAVLRFYALPEQHVAAIVGNAIDLVRSSYDATRLTSNLLRVWQDEKIDIMVVSWNNVAQLSEVIRRLQTYTSLPAHLVICDNGSQTPVLAHLCDVYAAYDNVTVILNRANVYVGPGTNICLQHSDSEYAIYVCGKEGFVLDHGWEYPLVRYMDSNPEVGLAGTLCYSPSYLTGELYQVNVPEFPRFRNQWFAKQNSQRRFAHVQGGFFAIRREMYSQIGGFSEQVPHNYTDVEYSYYAESCGWKLGPLPGLLALFNKTRPNLFSRIDESIAATHPPTLNDLPVLDRIANRKTVFCNLCQVESSDFEESEEGATCRNCGALPEDRALYRFLAESMLTYRRLPALGINIGSAMLGFWRQQFQGVVIDGASLAERVVAQGQLAPRAGSMKFVYANLVEPADAVLREVGRLLSPDGILLVRLSPQLSMDQVTVALQRWVDACSLRSFDTVKFCSSVLRYDTLPFHVGRRVEVDRCVS